MEAVGEAVGGVGLWREEGEEGEEGEGIGEYGRELYRGRGEIYGEWEVIYPGVYRRQIYMEMLKLLDEVGGMERRRLEKRMLEFLRCGSMVGVRSCDCCGGDREGSGSYAGSHRTCKLTVCPTCGWVRGKKLEEYYRRLGEDITTAGLGSGFYEWQFLTFTTRYDPYLEKDVTWEALKHRARLLITAVSKLWKKELKTVGAGMFRTIECSKRGNVHAHVLYFGPSLDEKELTEAAQKIDKGLGYVYRKKIESKSGSQLPEMVAKIARYMAKGTSAYGAEFNEVHHAYGGESVAMMHPGLAARWELATQRMHLSQKYGIFRGIKYESSDYSYEPPNDSEVACEHCGVVGEWHTEYRRAEVWIQDCHAQGKAALIGGQYVPWWKKHKLPSDW
jgi:hypothetical protein